MAYTRPTEFHEEVQQDLRAFIYDLRLYEEQFWDEIGLAIEGPQAAVSNGRIPDSLLKPIPGGKLRAGGAAESWIAMRNYIGNKHGVWIRPLGPNSSYRTYSAQVYFWNLYTSGRGNPAARPGTSNHGWGNAVDVATPAMASYIRIYGPRFGWSWDEGRRVGEWWHFRYVGGYKPVKTFKALRYKSTGTRVKWVQRRLRAKGFKSVPGPGKKGYGFYGKTTVSAVRRFQRAHKLGSDGVVGRKTWGALSK